MQLDNVIQEIPLVVLAGFIPCWRNSTK